MDQTPTPEELFADAGKLRAKAKKAWSLFSDKTSLFERSAAKYEQAGKGFRTKMIPENARAGESFALAAEVHGEDLGEPMEAANMHIEAFRCYRREQPQKAEQYMISAIRYNSTGGGTLSRAAGLQKELSEFYAELGDQKKSLEAYMKSGQWHEANNNQNQANTMYLKAADLAALEGDYQTAISKIEAVAKSSINNSSLRFSVNDYFMKAGICHLASGDLVATRRALQSYSDLDNGFTHARERLLLDDLCQAVEEGDQDKFSERLALYDRSGRIDNWKVTLLLRVKNNIEKQEEDFS